MVAEIPLSLFHGARSMAPGRSWHLRRGGTSGSGCSFNRSPSDAHPSHACKSRAADAPPAGTAMRRVCVLLCHPLPTTHYLPCHPLRYPPRWAAGPYVAPLRLPPPCARPTAHLLIVVLLGGQSDTCPANQQQDSAHLIGGKDTSARTPPAASAAPGSRASWMATRASTRTAMTPASAGNIGVAILGPWGRRRTPTLSGWSPSDH